MKILVTGPLADDKNNLIGAWSASGEGRHCVSLYEGLRQHSAAGNYTFEHIKGCEIEGNDKSQFNTILEKAKASDVIILAIGEHKDMSGEATSKSMIRIPGVQEDLLKALKSTGKPIITVVMNGRPLILKDVDENSDAVLEAWWLGTQTGHALADIIYGDYNPSGKLPISFPRNEGQIPIYYNPKTTGRPINPNDKYTTKYLDVPNTPLYSFGYGLSYTTFTYSNPSTSKVSFSDADQITISVNVTNSGNYDGEEVVQLYIRDLVASVTRPVKELKAFKKLMIKKGETKKVDFILSKKDFEFYDQKMVKTTESGEFHIFVGSNSDTKNKISVFLTK